MPNFIAIPSVSIAERMFSITNPFMNYILEKMFLSCETCALSSCLLLNNKICLKYEYFIFD